MSNRGANQPGDVCPFCTPPRVPTVIDGETVYVEVEPGPYWRPFVGRNLPGLARHVRAHHGRSYDELKTALA
jgi:hypothetical protein